MQWIDLQDSAVVIAGGAHTVSMPVHIVAHACVAGKTLTFPWQRSNYAGPEQIKIRVQLSVHNATYY